LANWATCSTRQDHSQPNEDRDYLLAEIKEIAERATLAEIAERLHKSKPVSARIDNAHLVREEREGMGA